MLFFYRKSPRHERTTYLVNSEFQYSHTPVSHNMPWRRNCRGKGLELVVRVGGFSASRRLPARDSSLLSSLGSYDTPNAPLLSQQGPAKKTPWRHELAVSAALCCHTTIEDRGSWTPSLSSHAGRGNADFKEVQKGRRTQMPSYSYANGQALC